MDCAPEVATDNSRSDPPPVYSLNINLDAGREGGHTTGIETDRPRYPLLSVGKAEKFRPASGGRPSETREQI